MHDPLRRRSLSELGRPVERFAFSLSLAQLPFIFHSRPLSLGMCVRVFLMAALIYMNKPHFSIPLSKTTACSD